MTKINLHQEPQVESLPDYKFLFRTPLGNLEIALRSEPYPSNYREGDAKPSYYFSVYYPHLVIGKKDLQGDGYFKPFGSSWIFEPSGSFQNWTALSLKSIQEYFDLYILSFFEKIDAWDKADLFRDYHHREILRKEREEISKKIRDFHLDQKQMLEVQKLLTGSVEIEN